ncbi:MAG TPA: hypothetical protein VGJ60_20365 [Chloroflexota bacterium]|jgi:hypothetical protein
MSLWTIELEIESNDAEHMNNLCGLTQTYLRAAMEHTARHDAKLVGVILTRKEEPRAADDLATAGHPVA